jgi:hypothetical protein
VAAVPGAEDRKGRQDWKKADQDFSKGFESYPPSAKQLEQKKKERANEKPKPEHMQ